MVSLHKNRSLLFLDLSHNRIGEMEEYNTVNPGFITGGESIAEMLLQNDTLLDLDLSWNNIRKDSAHSLVELLANNNNLRKLSLGDFVGQCLGISLSSNAALTSLDISFNNILPHGTMVIAHALERNEVLKDINLNGNSVGPIGARSLMRAVRLVAATGRILKANFENSNMNYVSNVINRSEPSGEYVMNMENPYDYTVVCILYEIANAKSASKFVNLRYQPPKSTKWKKIVLTRALSTISLGSVTQLVPAIAKGLTTYNPEEPSSHLIEALDNFMYILGFDPDEFVLQNILYHWFCLPESKRQILHIVLTTIFRVLFQFSNLYGKKKIDVNDISESFKLMRCTSTLWPCNIDLEWSLEEFTRSLLLQLTETAPPSPPPLIDQSTSAMWVPPSTGKLAFTFEYESLPPSTGELSTNEGLNHLVDAISETATNQQSKAKAIQLAVCDDLYLSSEQARSLMMHSADNRKSMISIVEQFLSQISSPFEACKFLTQNLTFEEILELRIKIGHVFKIITGNACGFYAIDLSRREDVFLLKRLNEINCFDKNKMNHDCPHRNTSQRGVGDWECFRNEKLNGKSVRLNSAFFYNIPSAGRLLLDFTSVSRPVLGITPIGTDQLIQMIKSIFLPMTQLVHATSALKGNSEAQKARKQLRKRESKRCLDDEEEVLFPPETFKTYWIHFIDGSWSSLKQKYSAMLFEKIEEAKKDMNRLFDDAGKAFQSAVYTKIYKDARNEPIYTARRILYAAAAATPRVSNTSPLSPPHTRQGRDRFTEAAAAGQKISYTAMKTAREISAHLCSKFEPVLQKIDVFLCFNVWFTVKQVVRIVEAFQQRSAPIYTLARLICTLFSRIVDMENFGVILNKFDSELKLELIHRLGILNVWSPMIPEGVFELDLAAWDHREMAKLLIRLAVIEPGENISNENYCPSVIEPAIPGWELPQSWTEDDGESKGPATYGYLTLEYRSDASIGCVTVLQAREELTFARCLAGARGSFIRGLNVRPKSRLKRAVQYEHQRQLLLTTDPLYGDYDNYESEYDWFHSKAKDTVPKYFGEKAKFQRAPVVIEQSYVAPKGKMTKDGVTVVAKLADKVALAGPPVAKTFLSGSSLL